MRILVLAGGSDQIALIKELRTRGHYVLLVDYFENPPARQYADCHIIASTLDIERVKDIAIENKVNLICTACTDQALLSVAKVSEDLSLPCYISYQTALNVTNKLYMKKVMMNFNIPTSRYVIVSNDDVVDLQEFVYPLVVKPVDSNSSKGVKKIDNRDELTIALENAISLSRTGNAIIEEFKIGEEVSADFYVENGEVKLLCATKSTKIRNRKSFTILQSCYPAISFEQEVQLVDIAQQISLAFNLTNTPLLIQLILNDNQFSVLEFSARMGGGSKYKLIEVLSGVNIMEKYVDLILENNPIVTPTKRMDYAAMNYVYCSQGVLDSVRGIQEMYNSSLIDCYFLYKTQGMELTKSETSSDRVAGYLVTASNKQELSDKINYIDANLAVLDKNGVDIMLHGLIQ